MISSLCLPEIPRFAGFARFLVSVSAGKISPEEVSGPLSCAILAAKKEQRREIFMDDLTGQHWGSYQLVRLLNRGSSADVYTGNHTRFLTPAVLEIFHARLTDERVAVFQNEARSLIQLVHAHIVRLLDFDIQDARPFLVLDAAPGGLVSQRSPTGRDCLLSRWSPIASRSPALCTMPTNKRSCMERCDPSTCG
jgi:serine/threonine protein kinase